MARLNVRCPDPQCRKLYVFDDEKRGKRCRCKKCGRIFVLEIGDSISGIITPAPPATTAPPISVAPPAPAAAKTAVTNDARERGPDGIPLIWQPGDVIADLFEVRQLGGKEAVEGGMGRINLVWHKEWQVELAVRAGPAAGAAGSVWKAYGRKPRNGLIAFPCTPTSLVATSSEFWAACHAYFWSTSVAEPSTTGCAQSRFMKAGRNALLQLILDIAIQTAWGLNYIHGFLGIIHQDFKPANVLMTADGVAKVTDFGIAQAKESVQSVAIGRPGESIVVPGYGLHTPGYESPEQAQRHSLTRRTDIWSWASSILRMFLEQYRGRGVDAPGILEEYLRRRTACIARMPPMLAELLSSCLRIDPDSRPKDLMQVAEALQTIYREAIGQPYPRDLAKPGELLADSFNNRAVSLFELGKQETAETKWQEALRVDPHHPEARYNWGLIQWRSLRMTDQKLLENLREIRTSTPDSARVDYSRRGWFIWNAPMRRPLFTAHPAGPSRPVQNAGIATAMAWAESVSDPSEHLPCIFQGHTGPVSSVSWSPDGRYLLSGSWDHTVRLWEVFSGKCLRTFEADTDIVESVAWSPDGRYALSGGQFATLRLWDVSSGKCRRTFEGHTQSVNSVSWSPDGRFAISGSEDKTVRLLGGVATSKCLFTLQGHAESVKTVSWSPDGRYVLSGGWDKTVCMLGRFQRKVLARFRGL